MYVVQWRNTKDGEAWRGDPPQNAIFFSGGGGRQHFYLFFRGRQHFLNLGRRGTTNSVFSPGSKSSNYATDVCVPCYHPLLSKEKNTNFVPEKKAEDSTENYEKSTMKKH